MLASALLARVKDLACDERLPSRQAASFKLDLAHDLKAEGLALLQVAEQGGVLPGHMGEMHTGSVCACGMRANRAAPVRCTAGY